VTKKGAIFFILFLIFVSSVFTQGENLTIKVAIAGPGNELYFWWGHIALVIEDSDTGRSRFYDWGLFSFDSENFFTNFAMGRMLYSCGVSSYEANINHLKNINRGIVLYTLDLSGEAKVKVKDFVDNNILPENRNYLYHHFKDNCTGPILKILDIATDGQFFDRLNIEPGRFTLRQHVRRHTWFSPFVDWILNFWMGQDIDLPITVWEEMYLPSEVANQIQNFNYIDSNGMEKPLVSDIEYIFLSEGRPPVLETPFVQWKRELIFGLVLALTLSILFIIQAKHTAFGQVSLGICHSLFGLVFGGAGLVLFFMSIFTEHDYTYNNINILFCNPLLLAAIPLGIKYAASDNYNKRLKPELLLRLLWLMVTVGIIISMLLKLSPRFWQDNLTDQLLMLPIAVLLAFEPVGLKRMLRRLFWRWL